MGVHIRILQHWEGHEIAYVGFDQSIAYADVSAEELKFDDDIGGLRIYAQTWKNGAKINERNIVPNLG